MSDFTKIKNCKIKAFLNTTVSKVFIFLILLNCANAEESTNKFQKIPNSEIPQTWTVPGSKDSSKNKQIIGIHIISDNRNFLRYAFSILDTIELLNKAEFFQTTEDYKPFVYVSIDDIITDNKINYNILNITDESEKEFLSQIRTKSNECYIMFIENLIGAASIIAFDNTNLNSEEESIKCFISSIYAIFYGPNFEDYTPPNEISDFLIFNLDLIRKYSEISD